uniref:Uncharacterized protein n=1 Tax=Lygus hesperus TaxID=30085 RepID=A0A146L970_LYGHE
MIYCVPGNAVSISVSLISDSDSNCVASINYFQLRELGDTWVNFEHGWFNSVYEFLINHLVNVIMAHFGIMDRLNASLEEQAKTIISKQGEKICDIINGGLL